MFVQGQLSAAAVAAATVPPPERISSEVVLPPSSTASAPPECRKKESSSSDDAGLDVPLQSLVAAFSGPVRSGAMAVVSSTCEAVDPSRAAVVAFAEDVAGSDSSSHAGETVPPSGEGKTIPELGAVGDGNLSEAGFIVEDSVGTSGTNRLPDIGSIFNVVSGNSNQ